ncbi:uncharacterized protein LOC123014668 isoform X2 [Tribolium madens]|uniref:uncharacterized protein LOC123014668 isoform X2 n=1 Tax=Tribolium madens TaxID=41895 RepID=UPI001CF72A4C|nr:uncharacterized protein LOC123014668 isoform X2 [Tribolium madens]
MMERMARISKQRWHLHHLCASLFLTSVTSVEENQPEIFLSPRNFNPHPYEAGYDPRDASDANRLGPVVFPPSPPDEDNSVNSNVLTLERERQLNHPIDNHPYAKVARKRKYQFPGRFSQQSPNINPKVYEALSKHAARVLSEPASQLRKDYTLSSLSNDRKNYAFSYKVVDHLTGDDFSHTQSQNSQATNGEYRVKLPDGRVQIVSYIADKNGYKADVKYTENDLPMQNVQIQHSQIPIPILKANSYDYQYDHISGSHLPAYGKNLYAPSPTPPTKSFQDYDSYVVATPSPTYPKTSVHFSNRQPKVQIYPNGEINGLGNYIGSTVAPYLLSGSKAYHEDVVASTVTPTLAGYTQVYTVY